MKNLVVSVPLALGLALTLLVILPAKARAPWSGLEGTWCWGSRWRSFHTPFLRITRNGARWSVATKHYMHAYFMHRVRDVRLDGKYVAFSYWYEPKKRWAHCNLTASADTMTGVCDGEPAVGQWGPIRADLWRAQPPTQGRRGE